MNGIAVAVRTMKTSPIIWWFDVLFVNVGVSRNRAVPQYHMFRMVRMKDKECIL